MTFDPSHVRIVNDGKGKRESWEAHYEFNCSIGGGWGNVNACGYGADEARARAALTEALAALVADANASVCNVADSTSVVPTGRLRFEERMVILYRPDISTARPTLQQEWISQADGSTTWIDVPSVPQGAGGKA